MSVINTVFVIWGYGSENIFCDFADFLRKRGHKVIVLPDPTLDKHAELEQLANTPYVLLTSSHFTRDERVLNEFYPNIHIHNAFLELLYHTPPLLSIFYPHDLSTPLVINEPTQLTGFDLVLWPTRYFGYQPRPRKLLTVGWIGYTKEFRPAEERHYDAALLFSDICYHKSHLGVAGTFEKLAPILACGTAIKLPNWPGHEEFEDYFSARGIVVIPAGTAAGDVILDSRVIVSNSISSISVEASFMGTPVINLVEDYLPHGMQMEFLSGLPGCVLSSYADFPKHLSTPPSARPPLVGRFDPEYILNQILQALVEKHGPDLSKQYRSYCSAKVTIENPRSPPAKQQESDRFMPLSSRKTRIKKVYEVEKSYENDKLSHESAYEAEPHTDEITLATALRLLEQGEVSHSFAMLQDLVNSGTTHWGPYYHIARIAHAQGEADIALEFLRYAVEREKPPGIAHRALAELHITAGEFKDALSILSPLLRHDHRDYEALELLRHTLEQMTTIDPISWARLIADLKCTAPEL